MSKCMTHNEERDAAGNCHRCRSGSTFDESKRIDIRIANQNTRTVAELLAHRKVLIDAMRLYGLTSVYRRGGFSDGYVSDRPEFKSALAFLEGVGE